MSPAIAATAARLIEIDAGPDGRMFVDELQILVAETDAAVGDAAAEETLEERPVNDVPVAYVEGVVAKRRVVEALEVGDPRSVVLRSSIERHADASLAAAVGSDYMVEHWLAAYAVLLLGS